MLRHTGSLSVMQAPAGNHAGAQPTPMVHKLPAQADMQVAQTSQLTKSAVLNWKTPCSSCLPYVTAQTISIRTLKLGLPMNRKGVTSRHTCSQHRPDCQGSPHTCPGGCLGGTKHAAAKQLRHCCSATGVSRRGKHIGTKRDAVHVVHLQPCQQPPIKVQPSQIEHSQHGCNAGGCRHT